MGLGGVLAGYRLSASFGSEASESGVGLLSPGPAGAIGVGQRFYGGEVFAEFRVSSLLGPSGDVSFSKQVGGLGLWVGYRLLY